MTIIAWKTANFILHTLYSIEKFKTDQNCIMGAWWEEYCLYEKVFAQSAEAVEYAYYTFIEE